MRQGWKGDMALYYYLAYELNDSPYAATKARLIKKLLYGSSIIHNGFNQAETYALLYLEVASLKEYLETQNEDLLKTFVAIDRYRKNLLGENSKSYEKESDSPICADYVSYRAYNLNDTDFLHAVTQRYKSKIPSYMFWRDTAQFATPIDFNQDYKDALGIIHLALQYALDKVDPVKVAVNMETWRLRIVATYHV